MADSAQHFAHAAIARAGILREWTALALQSSHLSVTGARFWPAPEVDETRETIACCFPASEFVVPLYAEPADERRSTALCPFCAPPSLRCARFRRVG
jgi:hypothetical protein